MMDRLSKTDIPGNVQLVIVSATDLYGYGAGLTIRYAIVDGPWGECFIADSLLGICYLGFPDATQKKTILELLHREWPQADFLEDTIALKKRAASIFQENRKEVIKVVVKGTQFQWSVWQALLRIPMGCVSNYSAIAQTIGKPKAVRATGTAIGKNPVSYLIPCHRVVPKGGGVGKYLWGSECKAKILASEKVLL